MKTFEAFEKATAEELRAEAKQRFEDSMSMPGGGAWERRIANITQAQFYLQEIGRREDAKIARRDFRMELIVIVLIGFELVAASLGIWLSIRESNEQTQTMERVVHALEHIERH